MRKPFFKKTGHITSDATERRDRNIDLSDFQSQLVNKALVLFSFSIIPALAVSLWRYFEIGWLSLFTLHISGAIFLFMVTLFRNRLSLAIRSGAILVLWCLIGVGGILSFGLISGGITILLCICFSATAGFSWRVGLAGTATCALFLAVMGFLVSHDMYRLNIDFNQLIHSWSHWLISAMTIVIWGSITVMGIGLMNRHLTESCRLLRESRKEYEEIFNGVGDAIFVHNATTGTVVNVNNQMLQMYGCTREDVIGSDLLRFSADIAPYRKDDLIEKLTLADRTPNTAVSFEWYAKKLDGTLFWVNVSIKNVSIGGQSRILAVVRDITEQKHAHELLIQSEKMISVGGLAAGMAHELNNPLGGIAQTGEVLSMRLTKPCRANSCAAQEVGVSFEDVQRYMTQRDVPRMLENLRTAGTRASQIVSDMLSFARKSDSQAQLNHLPDLVEQTLNLAGIEYDFKKNYDFRQIRIEKKYAPQLPAILCEAGKIQQVVLSILRNGAEAMSNVDRDNYSSPPAFAISIENFPEKESVILTISDNGPGIPKEIQRHIFEPFFTTKQTGQGTGLGLSVSYFIVKKQHRGELYVNSEPGRGTTFTIQLPWGQKGGAVNTPRANTA